MNLSDGLRESISLRGVSLEYAGQDGHGVEVLRDLTLSVTQGEFLAIVGPSGCGKSTILSLIAGLHTEASVNGCVDVFRTNPRKPLGYVFQKDTLLPWRTLIENVCFGLEIQGMSKRERTTAAASLIECVGLKGFEHHLPHQLSGGMRQRANLARTLAYDPEIVLMDEPFGALDAHTRMILQQQLLDLWMGTGKTVVFVTHDLEEAILLSTRVVLLTVRPAMVKSVNEIDIAYPRSIAQLKLTRKFHELYEQLWKGFCEGLGWL